MLILHPITVRCKLKSSSYEGVFSHVFQAAITVDGKG